MRKAQIYRKDALAGILTEGDGEYSFCYDGTYLAQEDALPISLSLPLQAEPFVSRVLFPFFDGLIPEGWLLDVALRNADVSVSRRSEKFKNSHYYFVRASSCCFADWLN